jgi:Protein of unknown function (DUF2516)
MLSIGVAHLQSLILLVLGLAALALQGFALFDAIRMRPDAFPAAGKQTKMIWLAVLVVATLIGFVSVFGPLNIFNLIGVVAAGYYLADVRPAVRGIAGGGSSGPYGRW